MRIDHIQLACPPGGEERARAFFGRLLGMDEEEKPEPLRDRGGCWFRKGAALVHIGVDPHFVPQRKAHPGFVVEDVEALAERLATAGHPVSWDAALAGMRRFHTEDPFGNRLEFMAAGFGAAEA